MRPEIEIVYEMEFITPRGNVSEIFSITYDKEIYEGEEDNINFTVVHFRTEEMRLRYGDNVLLEKFSTWRKGVLH